MGVHGRDIIHSPDGATWTVIANTVPEDKELLDIAWGGGRFVAGGDVITAVSEDGQSWAWARRGGDTVPITRVVSNGEGFVRVQSYLTRVSVDGGESWRAFDVCKGRESEQSQPSAPVFGRQGSMLTECEGTLYARAMTDDRRHDWRRVGKAGQMPTPLLFAQDRFYGGDAQGRFWTSPTGFEWTEAEGDGHDPSPLSRDLPRRPGLRLERSARSTRVLRAEPRDSLLDARAPARQGGQ